ncbi:ctenidin-1 [Amyelois transitella]|uniref:ctenidin-1 n=1 Tax=Amyelois transitella TaxID=680683 RepID=UPI00067E4694|nr:ctenidin-1 [Amyelois transitella]
MSENLHFRSGFATMNTITSLCFLVCACLAFTTALPVDQQAAAPIVVAEETLEPQESAWGGYGRYGGGYGGYYGGGYGGGFGGYRRFGGFGGGAAIGVVKFGGIGYGGGLGYGGFRGGYGGFGGGYGGGFYG